MLRPNRVLQSEQTQLVSIEKQLLQLIPKIQEALNSLKVEELHLKSQSVQPTTTQGLPADLNVNVNRAGTPNDQINSQQINLGLSRVNELGQFMEEDESD
ncbi:uncharacterized protein LOC133835597 [Drosophila sulfurigaster albostrigata]|uniref:uncharacterized protein LOC133835597 n=1 Tax=Drosophila sulfurigaster albostrigata TaxID=89887 RepID=UPI002D21ADF5|nr:uncharacterized protein LOC133835597 [Drosophila sulfurigaster albostrigata]